MKLLISQLGRVDYKEALDIQERLLNMRQQGEIQDILILLEHPPVLTLGRRGKYENIVVPRQVLEDGGVSVHEVTRGGDVTYHGPGQIVGYPIMDLNNFDRDIKAFVWRIEEVFIRLLKDMYDTTADRGENKYTGVWVRDEKVTAIGIAVKRWVTMHGFAFNVNTQLEHFQWIIPCGLADKGVTSLKKLTGFSQDMDKVEKQLISYFCSLFGVEAEIMDKQKLYQIVAGDYHG